MTILKDVLAELFGMFVADARLTLALLAVVGTTALWVDGAKLSGTAGGAILLFGSIAVLVESVRRAGRRRD